MSVHTDLNALWSAIQRGDTRAIANQMIPRTAVSSAIPEETGSQQPMCRYPDLVERPASSPPCSPTAGTAGVGALYPVTCRARYYDAASRILEDEGRLAGNPHDNANELGAHIQQWIERARDNWEPR